MNSIPASHILERLRLLSGVSMRHFSLASQILSAFILSCVISTFYLYFYPYFHKCIASRTIDGLGKAPFRLLVFADPQLEGDTSLPPPDEPYLPSLSRDVSYILKQWRINGTLDIHSKSLWQHLKADLVRLLKTWQKRIDLVGNDLYLAHIYRTMHWYTKPTHVTVLGDLLGSQWISDDEFRRRANRYWKTVFKGAHPANTSESTTASVEELQPDSLWSKKIINVAGNHDIGYAGDLNATHVHRFETHFGQVNWEVEFRMLSLSSNDSHNRPGIRVVVLNSMNLDTRAISPALQTETYTFINNIISSSRPVEDRSSFTVLLTHIPLHKDAGVCVDPPFFDYYSAGENAGGIKEQNHMGNGASKGILEGIYGMSGNCQAPGQGMGRNGIILTGHDHEGCDVYHHVSLNNETKESSWSAVKWLEAQEVAAQDMTGIREITVRSMMGAYGGNAGLLSAWFNSSTGEWTFDFANCALGVQHVWWIIHIADIVALLLLLYVVAAFMCKKNTAAYTKFSSDRHTREKPTFIRINERKEVKKTTRQRKKAR